MPCYCQFQYLCKAGLWSTVTAPSLIWTCVPVLEWLLSALSSANHVQQLAWRAKVAVSGFSLEVHVAMLDIPNFFHKALAVFANVQYVRRGHTHFNFFSYANFHCFASTRKIQISTSVVCLFSSCSKSFWRTSCFFHKGQSSGIATWG